MGEHAAGNRVGEELLQLLAPPLLGQLLEERVLPPAEDLHALVGEVLVEPAQLEAGAVDLGDRDLPDQAGPAADALEVQRVILPEIELEQIQDAELFLRLS